MYRNHALFALVTVCVTAIMTGATLPQDSSSGFWFVTFAGYLGLSALSVFVLARQQKLSSLLTLRGGDLTLGIVSGLVFTGAALYALRYIAPLSDPRGAWLLTIYAQTGEIQGDLFRTVGLVGVVAGEELVWRGLVLTQALERWGPKRGVPLCAVLYAVAHLPTIATLAVPGVGYNPLLVLAALVMGLVWGTMSWLTTRLLPAFFCHLVFSYFMVGPRPDWLF
jgi:uncharacterized protein